jgi:hypothetical protein
MPDDLQFEVAVTAPSSGPLPELSQLLWKWTIGAVQCTPAHVQAEHSAAGLMIPVPPVKATELPAGQDGIAPPSPLPE